MLADFRPITPHIWRLVVAWDLKIPFYPPLPVAVWLIKENDDWILVDAATPEQTGTVIQAVSRLLKDAQPSRLILTHAHYDHGGAMSEVVKRWNVPIWAGEHEADFVTGPRRYGDIDSTNWAFRLSKPILREVAWQMPVARLLKEGEVIGNLEVIQVPGHTPGMIALHHKTDRALICGDTFMNLDGKLSGPPVISTPNPAHAKRSMQKLAALDFDNLLPSHDSTEKGVPASTVKDFVTHL
jgi:glyoxylase-like metal-dependent hydrolase (beta-lactamase superfamily II)